MLINMNRVVMVLDSRHVQNFDGQFLAGVKKMLFLVLIIVLQCMFVIKKDTLAIGEGPIQGLDNTIITAEDKYFNIFTESGKRFVLSLHYNGSNSFLCVHVVNTYQNKIFRRKPVSIVLR